MAQEFKPAPQVQNTKQQQQSFIAAQERQMSMVRARQADVWPSGEGRLLLKSGDRPFSMKELLARFAHNHDSTSQLCHSLTWGVHEILRDSFRSEGLDISEWRNPHVVAEPSFDKARSRLSTLMTLARDNLVATISKNDKVDNAVVLIDWKALEVLCSLARKGLELAQKFGDFAPMDEFTQSEAEELARLNIHKPLPTRQTAAARRAAMRALARQPNTLASDEVQSMEVEEPVPERQELHGQSSAES